MCYLSEEIKKIAVIAPAGPVTKEQLLPSIECLEEFGVEIKIMPHVLAPPFNAYLAASAKERAADLEQAWLDITVDLVMCVRGGFGTIHLLEHLDWEKLASGPMPLIGYSDITVLHMAMLTRKVGIPLVAPMLQSFKKALESSDKDTFAQQFKFLFTKPKHQLLLPQKLSKVQILQKGTFEGRFIPVNLAVLVSLCGTEYFPNMKGKTLIVEDVNEPVYKLDRYFSQLQACGILQSLGGLIFGQFTNCPPNNEFTMLKRRVAKLISGPVLDNFQFGHQFPMVPMNLTHKISIAANGDIAFLA